jgi:hypothetical protein
MVAPWVGTFMDIASVALAAVQSKAAVTKAGLAAAFIKQQNEMTAKTVEMLADAAQQTLAPPGQPGSLVSLLV